MRYTEADFLTPEAALKLMSDLDRWCRRTGTNYLKLVTAARVPSSTRSAVKQGKRRLTIKLAERLTTTMEKNPRGISKEQHKRNRPDPKPPVIIPPTIDRSPCHRCGTRRDYGCKHFPAHFERQA